ncbi:unnamed protein product [marine sediment metagenome]|uniref:Uncharacterized protein n=1 Tax=marine sediment metagenome TaxID=412755 RepID=X1KBM9_9ZZZZ
MLEQTVLVCKPVGSLGYVVPGSLPGECSQCGKPVWIAPSSWFLLHDNPETIILCRTCGFANMAKDKGEIQELTPAQVEEIQEYLKSR